MGRPTYVGQPIANEHPAYARLLEAFDAGAMAKKLEQTNLNLSSVLQTVKTRQCSDRPVPAGALEGFYNVQNFVCL